MIALVQHWGLISDLYSIGGGLISVYMVYHLAVAVAVVEIVVVVVVIAVVY